MDWRTIVAFPQRFAPEVCEFLDQHHTKGKLSKVGTFHLTKDIGALVPYVLCPLKIKKTINMLPLDRSKFKGMAQFKSALVNMFVYGYLPNVDRAIVERARYWNAFRVRWQIAHPESMAKAKAVQSEKQVAYEKTREDFLLYQAHEVQSMEAATVQPS